MSSYKQVVCSNHFFNWIMNFREFLVFFTIYFYMHEDYKWYN